MCETAAQLHVSMCSGVADRKGTRFLSRLDRKGNPLTMPAIYAHSHVVTPDEIDGLGHVNNLHYLKWMQTAAVAHSAAQGWPTERYREIRSAWVVRAHRIEYRQPAFVNDELII